MPDRPVLVHGIGMMGASLAWALSSSGREVLLHHRRYETALAAAERGFGRAIEDLAEAGATGMAVICTPVAAVPEIARRLAEVLPRAVITDVGSVKASICDKLADLSRAGRFVGSHPMCGSHLQGQTNAREDLYDGALVVLTPNRETPLAAVEAVEGLWRGIGCRPLRLPPSQHDDAVAQASHLPHILASLAAASLGDQALALAAGGFRDTTRIAAASPELWAGIIGENPDAVRRELARATEALAELDRAVAAADLAAIGSWLERGQCRRLAFEASEKG